MLWLLAHTALTFAFMFLFVAGFAPAAMLLLDVLPSFSLFLFPPLPAGGCNTLLFPPPRMLSGARPHATIINKLSPSRALYWPGPLR